MNKLANQKLNQPVHSTLDKIRVRLNTRAAFYRFERLRQIPAMPLEELFPGIADAPCVMHAAAKQLTLGNATHHELIVLSTLCAFLKPLTLFEFGTYDGFTTLHMALNSPDNARIVTIDLPPDDPIRQTVTDDTYYTRGITVGEQFHTASTAHKIKQVYADTTRYDHSALRDQVDLIFVDAGHAYDLVKSDTLKALEMVCPGGVILWHDYNYGHAGVYTYLHELAQQTPLVNIRNTSLVCYKKPA